MKKAKKIRTVLIVLIANIILITYVASANIIYCSSKKKELIHVEQNVRFMSTLYSGLFENDINLIQMITGKYLQKDLNEFKTDLVDEMSQFVNETQIPLCITGENGVGFNYLNQSIDLSRYVDIKAIFNNGIGVTKPLGEQTVQDFVLCIYTNFKDKTGENYIMIGGYTRDKLTQIYRKNLNYEDWEKIHIVDLDGNLILSSEKEVSWNNIFEYIKNGVALREKMSSLKEYTGCFESKEGSENKNIVSYKKLDGINNWYLLYIYPKSLTVRSSIQILILIIIFSIILFSLIIILVFRVMKLVKNNLSLRRNIEYNAGKSRFWSHISHEIRTPMNAIIGMSEIAKCSIGDEKKLEECLENIENTSDYLLSLINDILDMSKLQCDKMELCEESFSICEIIDTVKAVCASSIESKHLRFTVIKYGNIDRIVRGDKNRMKQVLVNILANACKFTDINGKIKFLIREETSDDNTAKFHFEITDSGIGIKKENLEKIFEPFEQAECNISSLYGGSGLGLSICKAYIQLMGGKIYADSEYGNWTTFYVDVDFPIASPEAQKENSCENNPNTLLKTSCCGTEALPVCKRQQEKLVLLCDDNILNLEVTTTMLEYYGYKVIVAHNGQEAVDIFKNSILGSIQVIIMDVMMPVKNGLKAAAEIRSLKREDAPNIKIIALTANVFQEDIQKVYAAGMDFHLAKPVKMQVLKEKLDQYFQL